MKAKGSGDREQYPNAVRLLRESLEQEIAKLAREVAADAVTLFVYDAEDDEFDLPITYGLRHPDVFVDPAMYPGTDRGAGQVVKSREPLVPFDPTESSALGRSFNHREGIKAAGGFPLLVEERALGVLFISYRSPHEFSGQERETINRRGREIATAIVRAEVFPQLRKLRYHKLSETDRTLAAIAKLAKQVTNRPIAIWLLERQRGTVKVQARSGVPVSHLNEFRLDPACQDVLSRVMETGEIQATQSLDEDRQLRATAEDLGSSALLGAPIKLWQKTLGVIGVFAFSPAELEQMDRRALQRLADMAGVAIENAQRARESDRLDTLAQDLGTAPNLGRAMQLVAETARELTGGKSSVIFLFDRSSNRFLIGHRSPADETRQIVHPREDGLTRQLLKSGEPVWVGDTRNDERAHPDLFKEGILSVLGVRVQRGKNSVGALYVDGDSPDQFTQQDLRLLETLATQVSASLGWMHRLLEPVERIEDATSCLFRLEPMLDELCQEIQSEFRFHYATVQLIRPEERTIENVCASGIAKEHAGVAKHSLDVPENWWDIQTDVARSHPPGSGYGRRIEVIGGWDPRFDRWIFEKFRHNELVRVWVPILLVRDIHGDVVEDWVDHCHWEPVVDETREDGWRMALELRLDERRYPDPLVYALGTVDAGYADSGRRISADEARDLVHLVGQRAILVHYHMLPHVLETIADSARRILDADAASIHFAYHKQRQRYTYEVFAGREGRRFLRGSRPDHHAIGRQAIEDGMPKFLPEPGQEDRVLEQRFPRIYSSGVRAVAAFPLAVADKESILYLYFSDSHRFAEDEIDWVQLFVKRAQDAIRHATELLAARDHVRQLDNLQAIQSLLINPESPELLWDIAGYSANLLAADLVTLSTYSREEDRFLGDPKVAGRLAAPMNDQTIREIHSRAKRLIESAKDLFEPDTRGNPILCPPGDEGCPLIEQEAILSSAGLLLKVGDEPVGTMFVHYRTHHQFGKEDGRLTRTLAFAAAIAIKTARSYQRATEALKRHERELTALHEIDKAIVARDATLEDSLDLILEKALALTGAHYGYIMWFIPSEERLELKAERGLPHDAQVREPQSLDRGIVGKAAREHRPVRVFDVKDTRWQGVYIRAIPETRSELAVPLLGEGGLLGVLNVEHPEPGAFTEDDQVLVERLAFQGVIVWHSLDLYRKLERQVNPLHSLATIAPRIQDARHDLDTILRLLLTGVTANQGLGFSRAMLFLVNEEVDRLEGGMAVGERTLAEANATWDRLAEHEHGLEQEGRDVLVSLLDEAELFSRQVQGKERSDSPLSVAVQGISIDLTSDSSAPVRCILARQPIAFSYDEPDAFRRVIEQKLEDGRERQAFACVPLVGRESVIGALVVDNRFLPHEREEIAPEDINSLRVYASIAAMSIENAGLRNRLVENERLESWRQLSARVAHIIGTRISAIDGTATRLQAALDEESLLLVQSPIYQTLLPLFERLNKGINRAQQVLMDFRQFSSPLELQLRVLDMVGLLEAVRRELQDTVNCPIDIRGGNESLIVQGDASKLSEAFAELISNAWQAMEKEHLSPKWIGIRMYLSQGTSSDTATACIELTNPGKGIPQELKQPIFNPYFSTKSGSSGLGLAIVREILKKHQGTIEEHGIPGKESKFIVCLPFLKGH